MFQFFTIIVFLVSLTACNQGDTSHASNVPSQSEEPSPIQLPTQNVDSILSTIAKPEVEADAIDDWDSIYKNSEVCSDAWKMRFPKNPNLFSHFNNKKAKGAWAIESLEGSLLIPEPTRFIPVTVTISKNGKQEEVECFFPSAWKVRTAATRIAFDPKIAKASGCFKKTSGLDADGFVDGYETFGGMIRQSREKLFFEPRFYGEFSLAWYLQPITDEEVTYEFRQKYDVPKEFPVEVSNHASSQLGNPLVIGLSFRAENSQKGEFWLLSELGHGNKTPADQVLARGKVSDNLEQAGSCESFIKAIEGGGFKPLNELNAWNWGLTCQLSLKDCWEKFGGGKPYRLDHWSHMVASDLKLDTLWQTTLKAGKSLQVSILWKGHDKGAVLLTEASITPVGKLESIRTKTISQEQLWELGVSTNETGIWKDFNELK